MAFVLDGSYSVVQETSWQRCMTLLVTDKAWLLKSDPTKLIHSQFLTYQQPIWVVLYNRYYIEYTYNYVGDEVSFSHILKRDKGRCVYCDKKATTVDHVVPKSQGGADVWTNLAACCLSCNGFKADRTPEQAGMKLLWTPARVDPYAKEQKAIYKYLSEADV